LRTPQGELTALPRPPSCIGGGEEKGKGWEGREGKDMKGEERSREGQGRRREGKGGEERGREEGKECFPHFLGQVYAPELIELPWQSSTARHSTVSAAL